MENLYSNLVAVTHNKLTGRLQIMSEYGGQSLILEVYRSVPIASLCEDGIFFMYVVGKCLYGLSHMLDSFQFQMPGGIELNRTSFESRAAMLLDKVDKVFGEECDDVIMMEA